MFAARQCKEDRQPRYGFAFRLTCRAWRRITYSDMHSNPHKMQSVSGPLFSNSTLVFSHSVLAAGGNVAGIVHVRELGSWTD